MIKIRYPVIKESAACKYRMGFQENPFLLEALGGGVADPHHFRRIWCGVPDPACHFDADHPDPIFNFDADPDPTLTLMWIRILASIN